MKENICSLVEQIRNNENKEDTILAIEDVITDEDIIKQKRMERRKRQKMKTKEDVSNFRTINCVEII